MAINIHIDGMTGIDIFVDVGPSDKRQVELVPRFVENYESARLTWLNRIRVESVWATNSLTARDAILKDRIDNNS